MRLQIHSNFGNYDLKFGSKLNLIIGDSSTGKTALVELLRRRKEIKVNTDASEVSLLDDIRLLPILEPNSMVIIDMDDRDDPSIVDAISKSKRDDICFVLMGRKFRNRLPVAVTNTFKFITTKSTTRNIQFTSSELINYSKFSKVLVEDSKSGFKFFSGIFPNTESICGNGNVIRSLRENTIVIFDSLGFGGYIEEFLKYIRMHPNVPYFGYGSFEQFILKTLFNVSEIPDAINLEESATQLLNELKGGYSKSIGCGDDACFKCKQNCKQTCLEIFEKSEYSKLLQYYIPANDKSNSLEIRVQNELDRLGSDLNVEEVIDFLPTFEYTDEALSKAVESTVKLLSI